VDAEGRDYAENSGGRARAYALGGGRTSRRAFVCGIVALVSSVFGMAPFSWAEEEVEAGLKILHVTDLNSPDWTFGARSENSQGEKMRNGKTSAEDRQRTDVGIGEVIKLTLEELKPGYVGLEDDIQWEIVEGDAYFGTANSVDDTSKTTWQGVPEIQLKILVNGDNAPNQTVRVKVKTKPIVPDSNPVTRRGFTAYATLDFNRKRPTGSATSFHTRSQPANGYWFSGDYLLGPGKPIGNLVGTMSLLNVFPLPTSVNFGGSAEGGVKVLELDGNPYGTGNFSGKKIPVVREPDDDTFNKLSMPHQPNRQYVEIGKTGFFCDQVGWFLRLNGSNEGELLLGQNHHWEWQCDLYYIDGIFAAQYNMAPTDSFANGEFVISYDERQKFTIFSNAPDRWSMKIEKFGSSVRRSRGGSTFNQERVHAWSPWGYPNSAPPNPDEETQDPHDYTGYVPVKKTK
jgi:hypothetical protein